MSLPAGPLFARPSKKGDDYDSDDERQRRKRARRELTRRGTSLAQEATLPELASAIRTQCHAMQAAALAAPPPPSLKPLLHWTLRPFQVVGVAWLQQMLLAGLGVVLADEMGLGKTMQSIAAYVSLCASTDHGGSAAHRAAPLVPTKKLLVVAPLSVVPTWISEFSQAVNAEQVPLRVWRYGGSREERDETIAKVEASVRANAQPSPLRLPLPTAASTVGGHQHHQEHSHHVYRHNAFDVLVTTPEYLLSDAFFLSKLAFDMFVFDEAHRLKNSQARLYQALEEQYLPHIPWRVLLTGTPLSNSPLELWSLMRLVNVVRFAACRTLNGVDADGEALSLAAVEHRLQAPECTAALKQLSECLLLRRLKADVLVGMPPVTEVLLRVPMSPLQLKLYSGIITKNALMLASIFQTSSVARRPPPSTSLLNTVIQLRKCCNHPYMFSGVEPEPFTVGEHLVRNSNKMVLLDKLLKKLKAEGHRVLLFSQFSMMLDILQDYLEYRGYPHVRLDGSVRGEDREDAVLQFQRRGAASHSASGGGDADGEDVPFVFLLSTRAGGVGLTLTAADTVIFYDHDWNPQMDLQAQQRAHRIGQTKPVTVYRLCSHHSVEEGILAVAAKKLKVASEYVTASAKGGDAAADTGDGGKLSTGDLQSMVRLAVANMPHGHDASRSGGGGGHGGGATDDDAWTSFALHLNIDDLLTASTAESCSTADLDAALSTAQEQQQFRAAIEKLKDDALLASSRREHTAPGGGDDDRGTRRRHLAEVGNEEVLEDVVARRKRTEGERLTSMHKAWCKAGYVTSGLPTTLGTYEAVEGGGESVVRLALLHHGAAVCSSAQLASLFPSAPPPPTTTEASGRDVGETQLDGEEQKELDEGSGSDTNAADDVSPVVHLRGDLFHPVADTPTTLRLVVVPVNNSGAWGSGRLFHAAAGIAPRASEQYRLAKEQHDLRLGDAHLLWTADQPTSVQVILAVIQKSKSNGASSGGGEVDLKALTLAMERVATYAAYVKQQQQWRTRCSAAGAGSASCGVAVSFHFPLFTALSRDAAYALDKILAKYTAAGERCYMYHAPPRSDAPRRRLSPQQHPLATSSPSSRALPPRTTGTSSEASPVAAAGSISQRLTSRLPPPSWRLSEHATTSIFVYANIDPSPSKTLLARAVLAAGGVFASLFDTNAYLADGEDPAHFVVVCDDDSDAPVSAALRSFVDAHPTCLVVDIAWLLARV